MSGCIAKRRQGPNTENFHNLLDETFQFKNIVRPDFGPIHITAATTTIILDWYKKAQSIRREKRAGGDIINGDSVGKSAGHISDNELVNENYPIPSRQEGTNLTITTRAIAINWSQTARNRLQTRAREADSRTEVRK